MPAPDSRYNPSEVEARWQAEWERRSSFAAREDDPRPKYYVLEMFPYPSGRIHMGHVRNYTLGDVVARYKRAKGFNVLHPMGWDAFGLPAENAAIERGIHPAEWTRENIAADARPAQIAWGFPTTGAREVATCDPSYYRHEQKMFLDFLKAGLAYRKESWVNWDPVENTVLANEQVIDGRGWRSGAPVEKRLLNQWNLKITHYAEDLLAALDGLDRWPDKVRLMQENWIGRSEGLRLRFPIEGRDESIEVYTTRPDTLFGASFVAISIDHPLAAELAAKDAKLVDFIADCRRSGTSEAAIETAEKKGYATGLSVTNPIESDAAPARLCRQFRADGLWHRRDLRLPRPRSARSRLRAQIRIFPWCRWCCRRAPTRPPSPIGNEAYTGDGVAYQLGSARRARRDTPPRPRQST